MAFQAKEPAGNLMAMFSEKYLNSSLENIATAFHHHFSKSDHFKVGSTIVVLLQNTDLLPQRYQHLIAIFLLWEMYKSEQIADNPFAYVFVLALQRQTDKTPEVYHHYRIPPLRNPERYFIYNLVNPTTLSGHHKEMLKRTPQSILATDPKNMPEMDLNFLELPLSERQSEMPHVSRCGMPCIVPDPDSKPRSENTTSFQSFDQFCKPGQVSLDGQLTCLEAMVSGDNPAVRQSLRPEFIRLAPPLHVTGVEDELIWLNPSEMEHAVQWDASMGHSNAGSSEVRKLMNLALRENLQQNQISQVVEALQRDPKIIYHVGFSPTKLPGLVEHNPVIAIEVLLQLMHSPQINDYFSQLVDMEMSLHSLEVVNRLTTTVELPAEFIHLYISNCISTCEQHADRYVQNRLVRLVCVFLQSLIRNKIIDVKDIFIEVQAFCIEFSRIREAAGLFRLLKSLDSNEPGAAPNTGIVSSPTK